ncbi:MAG TPA: DinB family protein, partial [Terriglobia bacterium]|nr:DinB family protein [Terriglobia bacterium]
MATKVVQPNTISTKVTGRWEQVCQKLAALLEEVPANKFDYRPVDGMRTFADVVRHVSFWNRYVADSVRLKKADDTSNELPKDKFSTKTQLINELKRSAADATEALQTSPSGLSPEMTELVVTFIE